MSHDYLTYREGKKRDVSLTDIRGASLNLCASRSDEYICCDVHVIDALSNCPFDCSYCFLQNYLTDGAMTQVDDIDGLIARIREVVDINPDRFLRIGTWELGDSLASEPETGLSAKLVTKFASSFNNAVLELKTKSANVDSLIGIDHKGRTVVSWSMNPESVIGSEELKTASLNERIDAMKKVADDGYPVAIHFDPMIFVANWEAEYKNLAKDVFGAIAPESIAWVSIGALRFNPEMKKKIEANFPKSKITSAEMVAGPDGKVRYVKPLRVKMFKVMYEAIREYVGDLPYVYLCMERTDVWEKVLNVDCALGSSSHIDYLMAESLYNRFDGMVLRKPIAPLARIIHEDL